MKLEKPDFPWGELIDILIMGFFGGLILMAAVWAVFKMTFPVEAVLQ